MYTPYKPGAGVTEEGDLWRYYKLSTDRQEAETELNRLKHYLAFKHPDKARQIHEQNNQWIRITRPDTTKEDEPYILAVAADMSIFSPVPKPDFDDLRPRLKF